MPIVVMPRQSVRWHNCSYMNDDQSEQNISHPEGLTNAEFPLTSFHEPFNLRLFWRKVGCEDA